MCYQVRRVFLLCLLSLVLTSALDATKYSIPDVKIEVKKPKGFRASIPDSPKIGLFVFQGNINRKIKQNGVGEISGEILEPKNGEWSYDDPMLELSDGDVINYYVVVSKDGAGYIKDGLTYTVKDQTTPLNPPVPANCKPTLTTIRGKTTCAGQVIFEDHFNDFQSEVWQVEQYIPIDQPEVPFVSYQNKPNIVSVDHGLLKITPILQQNLTGYNSDSITSGTLNLYTGCTGSGETCYAEALGAQILPPIASGRITSRGLNFMYGTVFIRAKLPIGDWLYPEILLEPLIKKYGSLNYASGVMKIAMSRGNANLRGDSSYGNEVLYGGPVMNLACREKLLKSKNTDGAGKWGDDFHEYSLRWTPDEIILSVDNKEYGRIAPSDEGLRGQMKGCQGLSEMLSNGNKMAPFDGNFYITLGVSAGGILDFPDSILSNDHEKPWMNHNSKARSRFWQDRDNWLKTWSSPSLFVDYVKIVAL